MVWVYQRCSVKWALHHDIQLHFDCCSGLGSSPYHYLEVSLLVALHQSAGQALFLGFTLKPSIQALQVVGVEACAAELAL